jgi:hypothetical protein
MTRRRERGQPRTPGHQARSVAAADLVAWRQHRAGLTVFVALIGLTVIAMARETGTARFAWVQGAGRTRWLIATAVPAAALLVLIALGLGLEFRWWVTPLLPRDWSWRPDLFGLNPLPFVGWILLGFSVAVFLGAAIRRTVPAMAATLACYLPLMYLVATTWRRAYLPPLHRATAQPIFTPGGGYGYAMYWGNRSTPGPNILSTALGWPSGRLLANSGLRGLVEARQVRGLRRPAGSGQCLP